MTKCPKCHQTIEYIHHFEDRRVHSVLEKDGSLHWKSDSEACDPDVSFECPECNADIAATHEEAVAILNNDGGKTDVKEVSTLP